VGGGPAGLNAALVLGRCGRRVLLCDAGAPRNTVSYGVNGFLTRDGCKPADLRRIGRGELKAYPSVELRDEEVTDARAAGDGFRLALAEGGTARARKLLLATGLVEELPPIEGFERLWGRGVHHCPYCDGWENRGKPIAVYGRDRAGLGLALEMRVWSDDVVLLTDGPCALSSRDSARLRRRGVRVIEDKVLRLEDGPDGLERIQLEGGNTLERHAVFYVYGERKPSPLVERLGLTPSRKGTVTTQSYERTEIPGLYVAGDASRRVQFAIVAAAEGAMAAFAINSELINEDLA
jgi:thioredoxin reductase